MNEENETKPQVQEETTNEQPVEENYTELGASWIREYEDGRVEVNTKNGVYVFEEVIEDTIERTKKRTESTNTSFQSLLVPQSHLPAPPELKDTPEKKYIREKLTDRAFKNLKASVSTRLKYAVMEINGLMDFLE